MRLQPIGKSPADTSRDTKRSCAGSIPSAAQVSPNEFIRLAEETSLIIPVGDYVLARVCDMLVELHRRGRTPLPFIALNVSARQLEDPTWSIACWRNLAQRALPPDRLEDRNHREPRASIRR